MTPFDMQVGESYFVMTATFHWLGTCSAAGDDLVVLSQATWVADTGLLADFLKDGLSVNLRSEAAGEVRLRPGAIEAVIPWPHVVFGTIRDDPFKESKP